MTVSEAIKYVSKKINSIRIPISDLEAIGKPLMECSAVLEQCEIALSKAAESTADTSKTDDETEEDSDKEPEENSDDE